MPLLVMIPIAFLPLAWVRGSRSPLFAAANGAFIFTDRATYLEIDGHRAVRDQLAEDIKFAQHVKRTGRSLWYGDGSRAYRVRMYDGWQQVWEGFTRNLFPAFSCKLYILAPTLVYIVIVFVAPPVVALAGRLAGAPWWDFALLPYLLIVALRIAVAAALDRDDPFYALLNPLAWAITCVIAIGSVVKSRTTGATWKGRVYTRNPK
jgi:hypothetical protein